MTETTLDLIPILTFNLGDKLYALLIDHVVEVAAMVEYSSVADSHLSLLGVINRHGQVVPLIDLRTVFDLPAPPIDSDVLFVVAQYEDMVVGLVVDTVNQVEYISQDDLHIAPGGGRWVGQVASHEDELLQLINLSAVITHLLPEALTTQNEIEDSI